MANFKKEPWNRKKGRFSFLPIALSVLLGAAAVAGTATSIWHMATNYQASAEFSKSVVGKVEVDPLAFNDQEPTREVAEQNMKEAAQHLSNWLRDNGQNMYDVSYELYEGGDEGHPFKGYLGAQFNIDKIKSHREWEEDKEYDNDEYLSFFADNGFNTNNKTLVYRWYVTNEQAESIEPEYTIINFDDCFHIPKSLDDTQTKVLSSSDGKWGVMYQIEYKDPTNEALLNTIYDDMLHAYEDSQKKPESFNDDPEPTMKDWQKPRLYIINNFEGMVNEANYHLVNYLANDKGAAPEYSAVYRNTEQERFAREYISEKDDKEELKRENATALIDANVLEDYTEHSTGAGQPVKNLDVLRWIDPTPGTVKYSIFNKYVDDIITFDGEEWKNYFPAKLTDIYKQTVSQTWGEGATDLKFFWHPYDNKMISTTKLSRLISYHLPVKVKQVTLNSESINATPQENFDIFKKQVISTPVQPRFIDSLFGGNALIGWLSLGFLIYLIGLAVILGALYRTTGVISWICLMFMLSMSMLIGSLATFSISMTFLFGLFTLSILGFMCALGICERMRRRLQSNEDVNVIINKTFKRSLFPTLDLSIASLLFGICFTYIAPTNLNILGLILVAGAFMIFIIMYLLNGGLHLLFFGNQITRNSINLLGKRSNDANQALRQGNNLVPASLDTTKLEFSYYSSMSKKNIKLFSKQTLIALLVLLAILIVGIILFSVFGLITQALFHTPSLIVIKCEEDLFAQTWFQESGLKWLSYTHYGEYWRFSVDSIANQQNAINYILQHGPFTHEDIGINFSYGEYAGSSNLDALQYALISIAVGSALTSIYGAIRNNFASFVPLLIGSMVMPIMMLSIASIAFIKFDQIIILGLILTSVVNSAMTLNIMSSIQDSWSRRDAFTREEFRFITSTALKNCWRYIWVYAIGYALFIICFGIFAPFGCEYIIALLLIGGVVSLFVLPFTISYLQYYFLCIRNNILGYRAARAKDKVVINLDEIDEQHIEGINKFTRKKAIPKIENNEQHK